MLWCVFVLLCWPVSEAQVDVDTVYGTVRGQTVNVDFDGEESQVNSFLGIPYAAPPVGELRFKKPEEPAPWTETFIADELGSACPQDVVGSTWITHPGWTDYDEDCLSLNIFTPAIAGTYPVLVYFHGGGYTQGANINYPGHFLATREIVVVVVNYRLGNLGFPYSNGGTDGAFPGNQGMWDQALSLQFVRENIANFYGDSTQVTVGGQSAGASSASLHLMSPVTKDLFQQAFLESGTEASFWGLNWPDQDSYNYLNDVAEQNGCGSDDYDFILTCMQALPWQQIYNTSFACKPGHFCQGMAPVVDGPRGFLPEKPLDLREAGNINEGRILTGITRDDGSLYTQMLIPEADDGGFNRSAFNFYMRDRLLSIWDPLWDVNTTEDVFHAVDWNYSPWPYLDDEDANRNAFNEMITDAAFVAPMDRQARLHSELNTVYAYVFDYKGENTTAVFPEWMGVPHMADIPYVFCLPLLKDNPEVRIDSRIFIDVVDWTEEDKAHCVYWSTMIANFVKVGNPTPEAVPDPVGGATLWDAYTNDDKNVLYESNDDPHMEKNYRQQNVAFWHYYFDYLKGDAPIPINRNDRVGMPSDWSSRSMSELIENLYL